MECCHVDDMSPENTIVGLPPGWVDTDVSQLYISTSPPQPGGTRAPSRSPPVPWWSERRTDSLVMILPGIWTCHVAKEVQPSCFNDTWNWRAVGSVPGTSIGNMMSIRDPKDFSAHRTGHVLITYRDVKQGWGQTLCIEAEARWRPRPTLWGRSQNFCLKASVASTP